MPRPPMRSAMPRAPVVPWAPVVVVVVIIVVEAKRDDGRSEIGIIARNEHPPARIKELQALRVDPALHPLHNPFTPGMVVNAAEHVDAAARMHARHHRKAGTRPSAHVGVAVASGEGVVCACAGAVTSSAASNADKARSERILIGRLPWKSCSVTDVASHFGCNNTGNRLNVP